MTTHTASSSIRSHAVRASMILLAVALLAVLIPSPQADAYPAGQVYVQDGQFYQDGQPTVLKGVNVEVQEYFRQPDFQAMAAEGFNVVRLRVHWATLQPNKPTLNADNTWTRVYDMEMLQKIKDYIGWAHAAGMQTIVDNHDCKWCTDVWYPQWTAWPIGNDGNKSYNVNTLAEYQAAMYTDTTRKRHMGAYLEWLARQLKNVDGIVGYQILNEPQPGTLPPTAETSALMSQVQRSWGYRIRKGDPDRVLFFQTRYGYLPGLESFDLDAWENLGNVAADFHNGFGARWGNGLQTEPGRDDTGEVLQKVNNNITAAGVAPYSGTSVAQRNHMLQRIEVLQRHGIPLFMGEWGEGPDAAMVNHGTIIAGMCSVGDHLVSWAHRDWKGPRGMLDNDGVRSEWADQVSAAANSTCVGS